MTPHSSSIDPQAALLQHACATCREVFPESMMKQIGERWQCLSCHGKEPITEKTGRPAKARGESLSFDGIPLWVYGAIAVVIVAAYTIPHLSPKHASSSGFPGLVSDVPEPWCKQPVAQWPAFTLVNELEMKGVPKAQGGIGFLLDAGDGQILGVTPSRSDTLGVKEDEPGLTSAELNQRFVSWRMYPLGTPDRAIAFRSFYGGPAVRSDSDFWLLRPADDKAPLPVTPLKIRRMTAINGMRLFVMAHPANDPSGKEHAFPCTAQEIGPTGDLTKIAYDTATVSRGFTGAPIVDTQGHLAGIVTGVSDEEMGEGSSVVWLKAMGGAALQRLIQ